MRRVGQPCCQAKAPARGGSTDTALSSVKMDLDGIGKRIIDVPQPAGDYIALGALDGRLLIFGADTAPGAAPPLGQLLIFDLKRKQSTVIASRLTGARLSADQKKLLLRSGDSLAVVDTAAGP